MGQNLVPVAVRGYNELCDRSRLCLAGHLSTIKSYQDISKKINVQKEQMKKTQDVILELKRMQINLSHRLLVVIKTYIHLSVAYQHQNPNVSVVPRLTESEKVMKGRLSILMREMQNLNYSMAKVQRMTKRIAMTDGYNGSNDQMQMNKFHQSEERVVDEAENGKNIFNFLSDQNKIIAFLSKTVQKDMDDLNVMTDGLTSATSRLML